MGVVGLEITHRSDGEFEVVSPRGDIDLATQGDLRKVLDELVTTGRVHVVVDLGETTFLDSTGLGALIRARRRTHSLNGSFTIICQNPRMRRLFEATRLDLVFRVHGTFGEWQAARDDGSTVPH